MDDISTFRCRYFWVITKVAFSIGMCWPVSNVVRIWGCCVELKIAEFVSLNSNPMALQYWPFFVAIFTATRLELWLNRVHCNRSPKSRLSTAHLHISSSGLNFPNQKWVVWFLLTVCKCVLSSTSWTTAAWFELHVGLSPLGLPRCFTRWPLYSRIHTTHRWNLRNI